MSETQTSTQLKSARTETLASDDEEDLIVHGAALGNDDVTRGATGIRKKWPAEELEAAFESLEGRNFMKNHELRQVESVIGSVLTVDYDPDLGIIYEAAINGDTKLEQRIYNQIQRGQLEVSVTVQHIPLEEAEKDEDTGALIMEDLNFIELSVVPIGASETADVHDGEHPSLSAMSHGELAGHFGRDLTQESLQTSESEVEEVNDEEEQQNMSDATVEDLQKQIDSLETDLDLDRIAELKQYEEQLEGVDDPVVIEQSEHESLKERAEQADSAADFFAEQLSDEDDVLFDKDELMSKFKVSELRNKFEEKIGFDAVSEPSRPSPRGQTESNAGDGGADVAALEQSDEFDSLDEVQDEIAELEEQKAFYEKHGWSTNAQQREDEIQKLRQKFLR